MQAWKEVVNQGPIYQQMLREGASFMNPVSRGTVQFYKGLIEQSSLTAAKHSGLWGSDYNLLRRWYEGSNKTLWQWNDILLMQRVLELRQQRGMTTRAAIQEAEKHIVNYKVPTKLMGNRMIQQVLTSPLTGEFTRYHAGVLRSMYNIGKDLVTGTAQERWDALGQAMAVAFLTQVIYPALDAGVQAVTGNPNARGPRSGMPGVVSLFGSALTGGDTSWQQVSGRIFSLSPLVRNSIDLMFNRDPFTGARIWEPAAPVLNKIGQGLQSAVEAAGPMGTAVRAYREGSFAPFIEDPLGIRDPSARALAGRAFGQRRDIKEWQRHQPGLIEMPFDWMRKLFQ
jgi:hypothetical protein